MKKRERASTALVAFSASLLVLSACGGEGSGGTDRGAGADIAAPRDSAQILADKVLDALGGREAWESTRFLAFRWVVRRGDASVGRSHAWDRYTGRYRLEYDSREGRQLALFHVQEIRQDSALGKIPSGKAWVDGRELTGASADSALARAYRIFINDTYWLLMPFKMQDPGVHLNYEGRTTLSDRREYGVVHLTFEPHLGVTEDQYWAYIDPTTGILAAWKYHLQGQEEPGDLIWWRDWQQIGPIKLSARRVWEDGEARLWFEDLTASAEVPEGIFDPPDGVAAG